MTDDQMFVWIMIGLMIVAFITLLFDDGNDRFAIIPAIRIACMVVFTLALFILKPTGI